MDSLRGKQWQAKLINSFITHLICCLEKCWALHTDRFIMRGSVSSKQPSNRNTAGPWELQSRHQQNQHFLQVLISCFSLCIGFIFLFMLTDIFYRLGNALSAGAPKLASSPGERQTQPSGIRISNLSTWPPVDLVRLGCPGRDLATWLKVRATR